MSEDIGPNDSPDPQDCGWVSGAAYSKLESDLTATRQKLAEAQAENAAHNDFMGYMAGELAKLPCCHDDGSHAGTPPMMWPELIACIIKRAALDLRAQRDQAVLLARELGEKIARYREADLRNEIELSFYRETTTEPERTEAAHRSAKATFALDDAREALDAALAKLAALNPPPGDDTLKV